MIAGVCDFCGRASGGVKVPEGARLAAAAVESACLKIARLELDGMSVDHAARRAARDAAFGFAMMVARANLLAMAAPSDSPPTGVNRP